MVFGDNSMKLFRTDLFDLGFYFSERKSPAHFITETVRYPFDDLTLEWNT